MIKTESEIKLMKESGHLNYMCHKYLENHIKPGITTAYLDDLAFNFITSNDAYPSFKGYGGFPGSICTSINDEVVHGIPSNRVLKEGDIISIDIGVLYKGFHSDSAWTYPVGKIDEEKEHLLKHTEKALYKGLEQIKNGITIGKVSTTIENYAKENNLSVIRELIGHGVGKELHEDPEVPNYGNSKFVLKTGMTIAVEPMLNSGKKDIYITEDDWTIITRDGKPSAHFEHTIVVTDNGYEILTGE